ncbi:MAG TPA: hypothetical protein VL967_08880 [Terracidiphilus sp.]|nr:hypothetical protein [Terracidiphilus sp.]
MFYSAFAIPQLNQTWAAGSLQWAPWFIATLLALFSALQISLLFLIWRSTQRNIHYWEMFSRQWVEVGNWSVGGEEHWDGEWRLGRERRANVEEANQLLKDSLPMSLGFELFNRTAQPLSVDGIEVAFGRQKNEEWQWQTFKETSALILRPYSSSLESSEEFSLPFELESSEILQYVKRGFYLRVHVRVYYRASGPDTVHQDFSVQTVLRPGVPAVFTKYRHRRLRETDRTDA